MTTPEPSAGDVADFDLADWLARAESLPPVVQAGAAVLRSRALPVPAELFGSELLQRLADTMIEAMRQAPGVGLAAPQLGVPLRVFVAEDPEERLAQLSERARASRERNALPLVVLLNPSVSPLTDETATFFEGCLSVRGYGALVPRYRKVEAHGWDLQGRPLRMRVQGWPARIFQHEFDHLNGTLYVDRMLSRSFATEAELPRLGAIPVDQLMRELGPR